MAKRSLPSAVSTLAASASLEDLTAAAQTYAQAPLGTTLSASGAIYHKGAKPDPEQDRNQIAKPWQVEVYRQVNMCGEARYAATLFAAMAGRAELGISEPHTLRSKATWVNSGPEVDALAELAPTVRERTKLIRDYMLHRVLAGECYLIARERRKTDPGYVKPPEGNDTWDDFVKKHVATTDVLDDEDDAVSGNPNLDNPIWEIVGVTELRKNGTNWEVRHDNDVWIALRTDDPVLRMWNPDPDKRREAWSPFRSLLPTLREIEWLTAHIFTQVKSRLMSAGVWFMPENLTFPPPPPDSVVGGAEAIAQMNDAQLFMASLAASSAQVLDADEVSFPTVVMSDAAALAMIDQSKLIKFWSEIDDKAMTLRSDAVRRFALGMDMPPEQTLGSSGLAVSNSGGSAGSVNHWGEWAKEEQTISSHIEPALDDFVGDLTSLFLRTAVPGSILVCAYNTASLRLRQDLSEIALKWYDRGVIKAAVALRETGFDPDSDMMDEAEHRIWLLNRIASGSATPEQVYAAMELLGAPLPFIEIPGQSYTPGKDGIDDRPAPGLPDTANPSSEGLEKRGAPEGDHEHNPAPYSALQASCEVLVLRALEKAGNRLLNDGKRGKDRDRRTPPHEAHLTASLTRTVSSTEFDFTLAEQVLDGLSATQMKQVTGRMARYCAVLYNTGAEYTRKGLLKALST